MHAVAAERVNDACVLVAQGMPHCFTPPFDLSVIDVSVVLFVNMIILFVLLLGQFGVLSLDALEQAIPADLAYASLSTVEKVHLRPLWGRLSLPSRWALRFDRESGREPLTVRAVELYHLLMEGISDQQRAWSSAVEHVSSPPNRSIRIS
jgi:hypothetical protein